MYYVFNFLNNDIYYESRRVDSMQLLVYNKDHWFTLESPERQNELNVNGKFDGINEKGDIIEIQESGYWLNGDETIRNWNKDVFIVLDVTDMTISQAKEKVEQLYKKISFSFDNRDDINGIYEYTIYSNDGFSDTKDKFDNIPENLSVIERNSTSIKMRLNLPSEWSLLKKTEERLLFQRYGKNNLFDISKPIKKRRFKIDLDSIPVAYKNLLFSQGWARGTYSQLEQYIIDKGE